MALNDTIAGIATPPGEGGIGIIRISGDNALHILRALFRPAGKNRSGVDYKDRARELLYGYIVDPDTGEALDEVLAAYMPGPHSYTAEDVVEINCHGGPLILGRILSLVYDKDARPAEPGEFTKRAFLNGRLDLSQAEAVMDLVGAKTELSSRAALDQLRGRFSEEISRIRVSLTDILVDLAVNMDYPDEDIEEISYKKLVDELYSIDETIKELLSGAREGKILRDGISVVIVGEPNVGKSSLMNALLRYSRAIVTEIPGTTRDTIEEYANIKGIPVRLTDTAGIRETDDLIENLGIERSRESLDKADLVICMVDVSDPHGTLDPEIAERIGLKKTLFIFNKSDKGSLYNEGDMKAIAGTNRYIVTSLKDDRKANLQRIEDTIYEMVLGSPSGFENGNAKSVNREKALQGSEGYRESIAPEAGRRDARSLLVTNSRHEAALRSAEKSILSALNAAEGGVPLELIDIDLKDAYRDLGLIIGDSVQADIIDEIFSRFCLGK